MHIISVGLYARKVDYVLLVMVQLTTVFVLSFLMALFFERPGIHLYYPSGVWWSIILTGIFATALAFYIQNKFQRYSTATKTAIIFSGEPIFGAIFAYLLLGEKVGLIAWIGGLLIIFGMIISQQAEKK
jgi:drug/metabolite transporter (DMT)-like permease